MLDCSRLNSVVPGRTRFGPFEVDAEARTLTRSGVPIKLQQQPFDVLLVLLERPGRLVPRDELQRRIWRSDTFVDFDHSLNIAVNKLRVALEDSADHPRIIETVPRRGYRFIHPVQPSSPEPSPDINPETPKPHPRLGRHLLLFGAVTLIVVAATLTGWWALRGDAQHRRASDTPPIGSIAVLPLQDVSPDAAANPYFSDSVTDEITTSLGRLDGVRVVSRTSVLAFRPPFTSARAIAAALGVDAIVEGTLVRAAGRVRIVARLIASSDERVIWTRSYDREAQDMVSLERDVTVDLAQALGAEGAVGSSPPVTPAGYDEYLRGRYAWNLRSDAALHEAIEHFIRVTAIAPDYAPAYAGLADCYTTLGYLSNIVPGDGFQAARAAANRALALDDSVADAHASLAYVHLYYDWDWAAAEREFRRALVLNPNYATAHEWYAVFLTAMMRHGEARAEIERAQVLDPLSAAIATDAGFELYYTRQYDSAAAQLTRVLHRTPQFPLAHLWLGRTYQQKQMFDAAIAEYARVDQTLPDWPVTVAAIGSAQGWAGRARDARLTLERLHRLSAHRYVTAYGYALVYAALGERDRAIEALRQGVAERTPWMVWLKLDPRWGSVADDPRFDQIVQRMGLP